MYGYLFRFVHHAGEPTCFRTYITNSTSMNSQHSGRRNRRKILLTRLVVLALLTPFVVYFLNHTGTTTYFLPVYALACLLILIYRVR